MAMTSAARSLRMKYIGVFICTTFLCVYSADPIHMQAPLSQPMQPGAPITAANDPFSPENIAQVAEEIGKLSPEQQEQLYKESLEFLSTELKMAPDEVEKMIMDEFVQGGAPTQEEPVQQPTPTTSTAREIAPTKTPEKVVPTKDLNDIATLLKNLADITDTIMRKASGLPDLPSRVDRWSEQRLLQSWQKGVTWARFKQQLELLVQKTGKLRTRDSKTQSYVYLPHLLNNISLKNNLERLYRTLKRYNETFVVSGFGIDTILNNSLAEAGSLSTEAKDALINILSAYAESFYTHNILKEFDALVEKIEPTAKKMREEEETAAKKALEASKAARPSVRLKEAGGRGEYAGGGAGYYGEPSSGGYYPDYSGYSPSYGYSPYGGYGDQTAAKPDAASTSGGGGGGASKAATDKDKEGTISKASGGKESELAKECKAKKNEIVNNIHTLGELLNSQNFMDLPSPATDPQFLEYELPKAIKLVDTIDDGINTLNRLLKKASPILSKSIHKEIAAAYTVYKDIFTERTRRFATKLTPSGIKTRMDAGANVIPEAPPLPPAPAAAQPSRAITPEALLQAKEQLRHVAVDQEEAQPIAPAAPPRAAAAITRSIDSALQILTEKLKELTQRLEEIAAKSK